MKNEYRDWLSERLKQVRKSLCLKTEYVAAKVKIKTSTYRAYEQGRCEPGLMIIEKLCKLYNITVDKFLEGSPANQSV